MIDRDKIILNEKIYYTCSWTGPTKVEILAVYNKGKLLVQANNDPFIRMDEYVFDDPKKARKAGRQWEHDERKRKREKRKKRKKKKKE